jgi:hypothetical protein
VVQTSAYTCPNYDDQAVIFVIAKSPDPEGLEEAVEKFEDLFGGIGDNGNTIGVQEDGYRTSKCHPSGVSLLCCGGWATNNTHKQQTPTTTTDYYVSSCPIVSFLRFSTTTIPVNWDAVGAPFVMPPDFFHINVPRGLEMVPVNAYQTFLISNDSNNLDDKFDSVNRGPV